MPHNAPESNTAPALDPSRFSFRDFLLLNIGTLLVAVGVYFFKFPNHFSTGGVSGISILLGSAFPGYSSGTFVVVLNVLLLALGFVFVNGGFGRKTVYASILFSGAIWGLERLCPLARPMTSQPLLELIFSVLLPAFGSAILFNIDASTGGTDITAMILRKYTRMNIGHALFVCDFGITVAACFVFNMEVGLFSILGLLTKALIVDNVIENINLCKYFNVVTTRPGLVKDFIIHSLHRSCSVVECTGAFTGTDRTLLLCVVNRSQAMRLNRFLKKNDPGAFVTITNTSSILGKGFRTPS